MGIVQYMLSCGLLLFVVVAALYFFQKLLGVNLPPLPFLGS